MSNRLYYEVVIDAGIIVEDANESQLIGTPRLTRAKAMEELRTMRRQYPKAYICSLHYHRRTDGTEYRRPCVKFELPL